MRKSHRGRVRAVSLLAVATASALCSPAAAARDSNDKARCRERPVWHDGQDAPSPSGCSAASASRRTGCGTRTRSVCPNITVKQDVVEQSADYWTRLKTRLASGSGLDDVQAIEVGFVADVVQNHADQFVNWKTCPTAPPITGAFYPWKEKLATTTDGKKTVGLGTDIGPEAICYRSDLLKKAGLRLRPGRARQAVDDMGRLHRVRQEVRGLDHQAGQVALRRQRGQHLLHRRLPGQPRVRRRLGQGRRRRQRRCEGRLGLRLAGRRRTRSPRASSSSHPTGTRHSPTARSQLSRARPG